MGHPLPGLIVETLKNKRRGRKVLVVILLVVFHLFVATIYNQLKLFKSSEVFGIRYLILFDIFVELGSSRHLFNRWLGFLLEQH